MDYPDPDLINGYVHTSEALSVIFVCVCVCSFVLWLQHWRAQHSRTNVRLAYTRRGLLNIKEQNPDKCCFHFR